MIICIYSLEVKVMRHLILFICRRIGNDGSSSSQQLYHLHFPEDLGHILTNVRYIFEGVRVDVLIGDMIVRLHCNGCCGMQGLAHTTHKGHS